MIQSSHFKLVALAACLLAVQTVCAQTIVAEYLALRGEPAYQAGWTHFNYVNPDAPSGGGITYAAIGSYDNFHRYALRGSSAEGSNYFYDSLMVPSLDESGVLYPLIAQKVEYARDYAWFIFTIHPAAKNQDGEPIMADDVVFSFYIIFEKGVPQFRALYNGVKVEALDASHVRYSLPPKRGEDGSPVTDERGNPVYDKEMMFSLADSPVFVKKFWEGRDFSEPLSTPPAGTGPYRVKEYKMGQSVTLERVKDYWAADIPVNKGRYNVDTIRYDYYRDTNIAFEAFKAGEYDYRNESSPKNWATGYTGKLIDSGQILRDEIPNQVAQRMQAFVFNVQRPLFSDRRIRLALQYFFDFEWMNKALFYGAYTRSRSYFQNTIYEARGLPDAEEAAVLEPLRGKIPNEVWTAEYQPPATDGTGFVRDGAREALRLFHEAGWDLKKGKLVNQRGEQCSFELLIYDVSLERIAVAFARNLSRYGINMKIRTVDTSQYLNRIRARDFDMCISSYLPNQTPEGSLMIIWHSKYIDSTWNTAGVIDEAVDYLTEAIANAQDDSGRLLTLGHALDRVLTWNVYVIPHWNLPKYRIAYKSKIVMPAVRPLLELDRDSWWIKN